MCILKTTISTCAKVVPGYYNDKENFAYLSNHLSIRAAFYPVHQLDHDQDKEGEELYHDEQIIKKKHCDKKKKKKKEKGNYLVKGRH